MIKILICGVSGRLGQAVCDYASRADDLVVTAGVDKFPGEGAHLFSIYKNIEDVIETVDVVIDFSRPDAIDSILPFAKERSCCVVIGTTGHTPRQKQKIFEYAADIPVFFASNMSLGVNLQIELIRKAAEFLGEAYDIEIIEKHHNLKADAPSGTALTLAEELNGVFGNAKEYAFGRTPRSGKREKKEIGIHAVRGGALVGEHQVIFLGSDEVLTIEHQALSKKVFAVGALRAARYLKGKAPGLYTMADMISEATTVTRIYSDAGQAVATLSEVPAVPSPTSFIFGKLAKQGINLDIISQSTPINGKLSISFSMPRGDIAKVREVIAEITKNHPSIRHAIMDSVTKLTIEGMGMERQSGVAAKLFAALAGGNIDILIVTTSETRILLCIENQHATSAISIITAAFKL
jgi:4-hydroxy-tetrahydrodipicolinate reductase